MRVLITGETGFIGSHFVAGAIVNSHDIVSSGKRIDIVSDRDALVKLGRSADVIIHCAGSIKDASYKEMYATNVSGAINIMRAAKDKILVNIGTQQKRGDYGNTKAKAHEIFQEHNDRGEFKYINLECPGVYGSRQRANYNCIVPTFAKNIAEDVKPDIHGDGNQKFYLIHVHGLVKRGFRMIGEMMAHDVYAYMDCPFKDLKEEWTPNKLYYAMKYEIDKYPKFAEIIEEYR